MGCISQPDAGKCSGKGGCRAGQGEARLLPERQSLIDPRLQLTCPKDRHFVSKRLSYLAFHLKMPSVVEALPRN